MYLELRRQMITTARELLTLANLPPDDDEDEDEDEEEGYVMPLYDAILLITLIIGNVLAYATFIRLNWV